MMTSCQAEMMSYGVRPHRETPKGPHLRDPRCPAGGVLWVDGSIDAGGGDVVDVLGLLVEDEGPQVGERDVEPQCDAAPAPVAIAHQPDRRLADGAHLEVVAAGPQFDGALLGAIATGQHMTARRRRRGRVA